MSSHQTLAIFISLLPLALLSYGCGRNADLVAIQEFSALANQAAEQFPNIANDIYASCVRSAEYQPISLDNTSTVVENDEAAAAVSAVFGDRIQALQDCENSRAIGNGLMATHAVLTTYLTSLGQLASDRTVNLENIDALRSSLQNSPLEGLNQVARAEIRTSRDHGIRVLDVLGSALRAIQNRSRIRVIQQVVVETDTQFGTLVDTIAQTIEGNYLRKLRFEENAIDEYYRTYIEALVRERTAGDTQSLTTTILNLDTEWRDRRDSIRQRQEAAQHYVDLLRRLVLEHHQLKQQFSTGDMPTEAELNQMIADYTVDLEETIQALQLAFEP